jgi:hypothetical protein
MTPWITPAGMPWDANTSRKTMRAWSARNDPRMGIRRGVEPNDSDNRF